MIRIPNADCPWFANSCFVLLLSELRLVATEVRPHKITTTLIWPCDLKTTGNDSWSMLASRGLVMRILGVHVQHVLPRTLFVLA